MRLSSGTLWLVAALAFASPAARADVLANGSFETGTDPGAAASLPAGSTAIAGWRVTRGGVRYVGTQWNAAQGARSVALNGADAGGIAQTFATQRHAQYTMRLYMAGDVGTLPNVKTMAATAAGQRADFSADLTGMWEWDPGWDLRTLTFTAVADSTTLELFSTMAGTTGPAVDSVSVTLTSLAGVAPAAPALALSAPAPNPSRGGCATSFSLAVPGRASLTVFDAAGRELAVLADGAFTAGAHHGAWDGLVGGREAPAGLYFVSLRAGGVTLTRRLLLLH
jgi:choice-of-anchor C domain-containing protein